MKSRSQIVLLLGLLQACDPSTPTAGGGEPDTVAKAPEAVAAGSPLVTDTAPLPPPEAGGVPNAEPTEAGSPGLPAPPDPEPDPAPTLAPTFNEDEEAAGSDPVPRPAGEAVERATPVYAPFPATWSPKTAPSERIAYAGELYAGVVGKAGDRWFQIGESGELEPLEMDREPEAPLTGVWPNDAWWVQSRSVTEGEFDYHQLRLMRLRGGRRWVPQTYSGKQWFHPGTDDEDEPHTSTRSGMLVYPASLQSITRVGGVHEEPTIGPHRGEAVEFLETGKGRVYVLSVDGGTVYAQTECELEECVAGAAKRLPKGPWGFGRRVARGKYTVSVLAHSNGKDFILHHRGKSGGWLLEAIAEGEQPTGMWSSEEGGLWTVSGEHLRWRTTEGEWRDVVIPEGLTSLSVALTKDRTTVWIAGMSAGAPKIFTTAANVEAPSP